MFVCAAWQSMDPLSAFSSAHTRHVQSGAESSSSFFASSATSTAAPVSTLFPPSLAFCGATKNSSVLHELCLFLEGQVAHNHTSEPECVGAVTEWCLQAIHKDHVTLVRGNYVGTQDEEGNAVLVDQCMGTHIIPLSPTAYGIWIDAQSILDRTSFSWFARQSNTQVMGSNTMLGTWFRLALQHDTRNKVVDTTHKEAQVLTDDNKSIESEYVGFWRVPSHAPVYGLQPMDVGNHVQKQT
jgi:hypothetical protein